MSLRDRLADRPSQPDRAEADLVSVYRARLLEEINVDEISRLGMVQRRARLERVLLAVLVAEGPVLSPRERSQLVRRIVDEVLGLGVLEPLIADETVTEIMVNGPADVYVERAGRIQRVDVRFSSEEHLYQTIDRIVSSVNRRVDESSPMVDARLPTGERVNVVVPPLAIDGPTLTIRRFPRPFRLVELVERGSLDAVTARLLTACIRARLNVVISGGTGTGKTTFLNALSGAIPDAERIVTIEDAAELALQQPHVVRLESRPANVEGTGAVTIRDLVRNALRMRPDRIIVGEVRGGEALDMLQAMNTGHEGSLATVHANTTGDALVRLETLASMSDVEVPFHALRDQVNNAVDLVVQLLRGSDGTRRVVEVGYVASRHRDEFDVRPLMRWDPEAPNAAGPPGRFVQHPLPQALVDRLRIAGEALVPLEAGAS